MNICCSLNGLHGYPHLPLHHFVHMVLFFSLCCCCCWWAGAKRGCGCVQTCPLVVYNNNYTQVPATFLQTPQKKHFKSTGKSRQALWYNHMNSTDHLVAKDWNQTTSPSGKLHKTSFKLSYSLFCEAWLHLSHTHTAALAFSPSFRHSRGNNWKTDRFSS